MADRDDLDEGKEAYELCVEAEEDNRLTSLEDIRFARLAEQWPDKIRRQRDDDGRPCLTVNRMNAFIRQVVNDARQNKPQIVVRPVDDNADPKTAEVFSGLIKNIEASSEADIAYDTGVECAVAGGWGYIRVDLDYAHDDTFEQDLMIKRVSNPFCVYGDPHSTAADSSDWNTAFMVELLDKELFKQRYKGADEVDWDGLGYTGLKAPWLHGEGAKEQIQLASWWSREEVQKPIVLLSNGQVMEAKAFELNRNWYASQVPPITVMKARTVRSYKVTHRLMTGAEIIEKKEWAGKYIPIVPVYGDEVVVEGKRYFRSLIADAKDPQRMFNFWRTASTELVALAPRVPFIGPEGAFNVEGMAEKWATVNTKSHPFIEYSGSTPPTRLPLDSGPAIGAMQEALAASDDMKATMGLYDASLGARSNETSGKAIMARQREGDVSTFHFTDNLSRAIRHVGRILVDLIPLVYTGERVIRVLGVDGKVENAWLGQKPPEAPTDQQEPEASMPGENRPKYAGIYDLGAGKYDVAVDTGPSYTTKREETAYQMTEFMRAFPAAVPVVGDLLVKALDWQNGEEIAKRLESMLPPGIKGKDPQLAQAEQAIEVLKGELAKAKGEQDGKERELDIKAYDSETKRLQVIAAQLGPMLAPVIQQTVMQILNSPDVLAGGGPSAGLPSPMAPPMPGMPGPMPQPQPAPAGFSMSVPGGLNGQPQQ